MLYDSPRVFGRTWVSEDQLLEQLDLVRLSLPEAFHEAEAIVRHKEEILEQAEQYAQDLIEQSERRAAQILNEMGILQQAEIEAQRIRQQAQQECELAKEQTIAEIERMRQQAHLELEQMQQMTLAECEEIQIGADVYADRVLGDMESQLAEMLRVIRNGRQQLQPHSADAPNRTSGSMQARSNPGRSDRARQ
jgi:cell division septum initiation protein DivIVA